MAILDDLNKRVGGDTTGLSNANPFQGSGEGMLRANEAFKAKQPKTYEYSAPNEYGISPESYGGTFSAAMESLGQPGSALDQRQVNSGTFSLANNFVDVFHKKTGRLPTAEQVKNFVAQNLTPAFASKVITGQINQDQIIANYINPYIQGNPDLLADPNAASAEQQRVMSLKDQLDKIYGASQKNLISGYDENVYGPAKGQVANDLAGQGMLGQPNSRYSLDKLEANRGRDLQGGLNTLESARASGQVDLGKTIEDLLQRNSDRNQNAYQFGKTFQAGRDDTFFNQGLQNRTLTVAQQLGQLQAQGQKNDGISGLFGGATSGASAGASLGPWGALAGGVAGGLAGYFGTKKG